MKKRILSIALTFALFSLIGCGNSDVMVLTPYGDAIIQDTGNPGTTSKAETPKAEVKQEAPKTETVTQDNKSNTDLIKVGFAQVGSESDWRLAQTASMKETFTTANGYDFNFVDCNNNQDKQLETLEQFISDKVDFIVLDPIVETGYDDVLAKAKDAGIKVIVVDRNISADPSLYACWVGSDFAQEGEDAANWLSDKLSELGKDSDPVNIVTILGSDGSSATIGRTDGFQKVADTKGNWNMLDAQSGDFTEDGGYAVMKVFLKQYPEINVVVCQNDNEAFGAITAIEEAGKSCGVDGEIMIISFDATNGGFETMIEGKINVDVECNPLEGPFVSELIQKLKKGETVESVQYMKEGVFPAETAKDIIDTRAYLCLKQPCA